MERDINYIRQYKLVKMVVIAQIFVALVIGGLMFLAKEGILTLPAADFNDPARFILIRNILWGISAVLVIFYILLQNALHTISEDKEMAFLKFWVSQLHVNDRSSAVAL
jgi:predicted transglutaminase-like protease